MKYTYILIILLFFACHTAHEEKQPIVNKKNYCLTDTLAKNIQLANVQQEIVHHELTLSGKITFDEDKVAKVYPLAGGFVQELRANLGDYVQKGQILAVIRSPEIAGFNNQSNIAQSNLRVAQKNYQIAQELFKTGSTSEVELTNAKKELENAQTEANRSKEVLEMYNTGKQSLYSILAPASGFVVDKDIALNMELRTEDIKPIFTISNMDNIWVMANVYESDIAKVQEGYEADITTISYPDKVMKGHIDKISQVVDNESKVLKARIVMRNEGYKLKPNMYANVIIKYKGNGTKITIPSKAVIFDKNRHFVMVYNDKCKIDTREIQIYEAMMLNTYLEAGLKEGEKVITKYQLLIYDAIND
jgi:membrane fusion protein, heavy metal efflux system